ncbi:MAG: DM13 domain-containing protein, partial [Phaeodactylibacter sp.]|nr:DM13 domain-containing protein [Phaeodactylibacter sp.]
TFIACEKEDPQPEIIDSSLPTGTLTVARSGDFTAQNSTPTAGTAALGTDDDGETFLRFNNGFMTELGTGTVSVYLSTSENFVADPMNGNPDLRVVGAVSKNGDNYFKLDGAVDSKFTHVILWCGSANIPFGYALMQ